MIHFRTFSSIRINKSEKVALGLINRKTPCHEAIMKVQPHWFNAECDKRIKEVGGANATSRQNTRASFDCLILFSRENFAQYSLRNEFSSSYVLTNFAQTLLQYRRIVKE